MRQNDNDIRVGVLSGFVAYTIWGFFPLYFKELEIVGAVELLLHRIVWAVPFGLFILYFRKQLGETLKAFQNWRTLRALLAAAVIIAMNWGFYVWAVQTERIFQASLGYYINPLVFILFGVLFTKEILSRLQLVAVALATLGVVILTIYGGVFPWVSFVLAITFTLYGFIRKTTNVGAMPGLFIETVLLFIPALAYWAWMINQGTSQFVNVGGALPIWLMMAGPVTVMPLLFFAIAARRLRLSTLGFLQYIGPTLQFCVGLYYGEAFTSAHAICFGFIWLAVGVYSYDAWRNAQKV